MKKATPGPQKFSFQSKLESISDELEYYALSVPPKVTAALGTKGPVPVYAQVNDSPVFLISLYPVGKGRHYLRVKAEIRKAAKIKGGDKVKVEITVRDRAKEISIPKDLASALKEEGVLEAFKALPPGKKSFVLRKIEEASKPETRKKRIQDAVGEAHLKAEKS